MHPAAAAAVVSAARGASGMAVGQLAAGHWAMAAHVYVSEGRDRALVERLSAAGAAAGATVANEFLDAMYHRAGVTLAAAELGPLEAGIAAVSREALLALDLRTHTASHPRVGVVDHIACNPLGSATCEEAGALAVRVGRSLGQGEPGGRPALPVYLYGAARQDARPLAELRRSLGYFDGAARGQWTGLSTEMAAAMRGLAPDFGPREASLRHGAAVVGAVPWVHNYNLLLTGEGLDEAELLARCRRVARAASTRGGGPPAVESMALPHERGVEVACNLLDAATTPAAEVRARVAALCEAEGLCLDSDYFTNKRPEDILALVPAAAPEEKQATEEKQ